MLSANKTWYAEVIHCLYIVRVRFSAIKLEDCTDTEMLSHSCKKSNGTAGKYNFSRQNLPITRSLLEITTVIQCLVS